MNPSQEIAEGMDTGRGRIDIRRHWRLVILIAWGIGSFAVFWLSSRYPSLFAKAAHVGQDIPTMAYAKELMPVPAGAPVGQRILIVMVNWLDSMKVGVGFSILAGAFFLTALRYYPLRIGNNIFLNSMKGALAGVPAGICANCCVPVASGMMRGNGRVEVALGFLFSSPSFNPVVIAMTFAALPLGMAAAKYALLLLVIAMVVPTLIKRVRRAPVELVAGDAAYAAALAPSTADNESFWNVLSELARVYARNFWALLKPTATFMLLASFACALLLVFVPWNSLLSQVTPLRMGAASLLAVVMPVPIALDVMFAAQLQHQGVAPGYVMLFLTTLGTYSIVPSIYIWRSVSKTLAVSLFAFFVAAGWILGICF